MSAQLGRKPEDIVKLDANENPYGPPPEASLIIVHYLNSVKYETLGSFEDSVELLFCLD